MTGHHWPTPQMHFAVMWISACVGAWEPQNKNPPCKNFKASEWWENDGVVSVCSQDYPRLPKPHKCAPIRLPEGEVEEEEKEEGLDSLKRSEGFVPSKGVWYYSSPVRMDHMTVSMAPRNQKQEHRTLYLHVLGRGRQIKTSHTDLASLVRRSHVDLMTLARLPSMSPPPSPTQSINTDTDDDRSQVSTISDWSMTGPVDVNTMARAASYSDIGDFFFANSASRNPSVGSNLSEIASPLEISFRSTNDSKGGDCDVTLLKTKKKKGD